MQNVGKWINEWWRELPKMSPRSHTSLPEGMGMAELSLISSPSTWTLKRYSSFYLSGQKQWRQKLWNLHYLNYTISVPSHGDNIRLCWTIMKPLSTVLNKCCWDRGIPKQPLHGIWAMWKDSSLCWEGEPVNRLPWYWGKIINLLWVLPFCLWDI